MCGARVFIFKRALCHQRFITTTHNPRCFQEVTSITQRHRITRLQYTFHHISQSTKYQQQYFTHTNSLQQDHLFYQICHKIILPTNSCPSSFRSIHNFLHHAQQQSIHNTQANTNLSINLHTSMHHESQSLYNQCTSYSTSSRTTTMITPRPCPSSTPVPSLPRRTVSIYHVFTNEVPETHRTGSLSTQWDDKANVF